MVTSKNAISLPPIHVLGYPSDVGGASVEIWHTAKLWRRFGLRVTFIPTWKACPGWKDKLGAIGCQTLQCNPERLVRMRELRDGIAVSFCNSRFFRVAPCLRENGCKLIWANCMNWISPEEESVCQAMGPFDAYVFQSGYQRTTLEEKLKQYGYDESLGHQIRGAFDPDEFPFAPRTRQAGEPFIVGRLSRSDPDKFSPDTWDVYGRIPDPKQVRIMGWSRRVRLRLGDPPSWAICTKVGAKPPLDFLRMLHCMAQRNGKAVENWPRVGLEAMAAGVPIVAEARGGWTEMIEHQQTGFLADSPEEFVAHIAHVQNDEALRIEIAKAARRHLEQSLAEPESVWEGWKTLFETITS